MHRWFLIVSANVRAADAQLPSTKMKESSSIDLVVDVVDATCAAVESDPAIQSLAVPWVAMRKRPMVWRRTVASSTAMPCAPERG